MEMDLLMPSVTIGRVNCSLSILECEWTFRYAQAHDILHDIRHLILLRSRMWKSKDRFSTGQKNLTRSATQLASVEFRIKDSAAKYKETHQRLLALSAKLQKVGWQDDLQVLNVDEDCKSLEKTGPTGEGYVMLSWIWKAVQDGGNSNPFVDEGMQECMYSCLSREVLLTS